MPRPGADRREAALRNLLLVVVTDRGRCRGDLAASCEAALRGGATAVLLRDRDLPRGARGALARELRSITRRYGAALLVHSDAALARAVGADGVHLDARAGPEEVAAARRVAGRGLLVGLSTHSVAEVRRAGGRADYAFFGPVWPSRTHAGRRGVGAALLREAAGEASLPLVAIGGATAGRVREFPSWTGVRGAAAIDAVLAQGDPGAAAARLLRALAGSGEDGSRGADERSLVRGFLRSMGRVPGLLLGPGDDAVVLREGGLAVATDMTVEGVHYAPGTRSRDAGFKAAGRALSDLAAVGAEPVGLMVGLAVRRGPGAAARARGLEAGLAAAATAVGARILGGDTKETPGAETISVTALGRISGRPPLPRSGGRPGDALFVTGSLGGSLLGRHLRPTPRIAAGLALRRGGLATACIDLSDGLASDLHRLCRASGTGALLEGARVPIHPDARRTRARGSSPGAAADPLDRALLDGEDYELLFSVPPEKAAAVEARGVGGIPVRRIGRLLHPAAGVVVQDAMGTPSPLADSGWVHLRERGS